MSYRGTPGQVVLSPLVTGRGGGGSVHVISGQRAGSQPPRSNVAVGMLPLQKSRSLTQGTTILHVQQQQPHPQPHQQQQLPQAHYALRPSMQVVTQALPEHKTLHGDLGGLSSDRLSSSLRAAMDSGLVPKKQAGSASLTMTPRSSWDGGATPLATTVPPSPVGSMVFSASSPHQPPPHVVHLAAAGETEHHWVSDHERLLSELAELKAATQQNALARTSDFAELEDARALAATQEVALEEVRLMMQNQSAMLQAAEVAEAANKETHAIELTVAREELEGMRREACSEMDMLRDVLSEAQAEGARFAQVHEQLLAATLVSDEAHAKAIVETAKSKAEAEALRNQEQHVEVLWAGRYAEAEAVFAERADADASQLQAALGAELLESTAAQMAMEALAESRAAAQDFDLERSELQEHLLRALGAETIAKTAFEDAQRTCADLRSEFSMERRRLQEAAHFAAERSRSERDLLSAELTSARRQDEQARAAAAAAAAAEGGIGHPRWQHTDPAGAGSDSSTAAASSPQAPLPFQVELLRAAQDYQSQCEQLSKDLESECLAFAVARQQSVEALGFERAKFGAEFCEAKVMEEELRCECRMLRRRLAGELGVEDNQTSDTFQTAIQANTATLCSSPSCGTIPGLRSGRGGLGDVAVPVGTRRSLPRLPSARTAAASCGMRRLTKVITLMAVGASLAHWGLNHWNVSVAERALREMAAPIIRR